MAYGAAVGAAAAGAYGYYGGYYNNGCYQDGYGNVVCPGQYPYRPDPLHTSSAEQHLLTPRHLAGARRATAAAVTAGFSKKLSSLGCPDDCRLDPLAKSNESSALYCVVDSGGRNSTV